MKYLLGAARILKDKYPLIRFVLVGEGSGNLLYKLYNFSIKSGMEEVFYFLGFRYDVANIIRNLTVLFCLQFKKAFQSLQLKP